MKKILLVRNIFITLTMILVIFYPIIISKPLQYSKTYDYFEHLPIYTYGYGYTITLKDIDNTDKEVILASNKYDKLNFIYSKGYFYNFGENEPYSHSLLLNKSINESYYLDNIKKEYSSLYDADYYYFPDDDIISQFFLRLIDVNHYTIGYELVDGKLLYFERFRNNKEESDMKFYFENDEIKYIKSKSFNIFSTPYDELYSFTLEDNISSDLYKIPSNYTRLTIIGEEQ